MPQLRPAVVGHRIDRVDEHGAAKTGQLLNPRTGDCRRRDDQAGGHLDRGLQQRRLPRFGHAGRDPAIRPPPTNGGTAFTDTLSAKLDHLSSVAVSRVSGCAAALPSTESEMTNASRLCPAIRAGIGRRADTLCRRHRALRDAVQIAVLERVGDLGDVLWRRAVARAEAHHQVVGLVAVDLGEDCGRDREVRLHVVELQGQHELVLGAPHMRHVIGLERDRGVRNRPPTPALREAPRRRPRRQSPSRSRCRKCAG